MKKACLVVSKYLQNNVIFDKDSPLNRDDIFDKYIRLKDEFLKFNYELSTNDINKIEESDVVLYFDMPSRLPQQKEIDKSFLFLKESEVIIKENYNTQKHKYFKKIFTWHDGFVDNIKYFKSNFTHKFPENINKDIKQKDKMCILIAGNKRVSHHLELYSKRVEAIKWFEKNHIEDFDLYGVGWNRYRFTGPIFLRALNGVPLLPELFAKITGQIFESYKGTVKNKKETMQKYKFSICYENAKDIPGYITEKIFDSFFAGCVPVYWGANNILDYVPKDCFIDMRDFYSYEKLYEFLKNMPDYKYLKYLDSIENYLLSKESEQFTNSYFSRQTLKIIDKQDDN